MTHNFKTVGNWNDEIIDENTWIQGPGKATNVDNSFYIIFACVISCYVSLSVDVFMNLRKSGES